MQAQEGVGRGGEGWDWRGGVTHSRVRRVCAVPAALAAATCLLDTLP